MMDTEELTAYIKNYLENDKTRSAIMLTGPWGCGKSYYIQNMLTPALIKDGVNRCIVVSLYGLKNLEALSKSIYLEVRAKALFQKSETVSAAKIFGKTIIKGVASFFGVDINVSEDDLNKLYHSIDLTDKLIVLEDLERSGIDIIEIMNKMKVLGFLISIDDFGTGYSSLSTLQDMPADILKIDKSFVDRIGKNEKNMIDYILTMAKELKLITIAEGVENKEQRDYLLEKGCDIIQGYYYAKPMPEAEFEEYMER